MLMRPAIRGVLTSTLLTLAAAYAQTVGRAPIYITSADFNNDGILDLAVANTNLSTGSVSILLGNGDGTFQAPRFLVAGNYPRSIAVADFNRDGKLDMAVANESPSEGGSISIFLGNGDGTFQAPAYLESGVYPASVVAADFDGDGFVDLAVANSQQFQTTPPFANGSVSVLRGNGDGSFLAPVFYRAGVVPIFLTVADFNGDGKPDVAAADFDGTAVAVLLNNGDGTLAAPEFLAAGRGPFSVASADLDGNGTADLVCANGSDSSTGGSVSVSLGAGDGTFGPTTYMAAGQGVGFVGTGDFNNDGKVDLAVANDGGSGQGNVAILFGNGDGTFQSPFFITAGQHPTALTVGDFNRDGNQDLAVVNSGRYPLRGTITILLGDGAGGFR